jgi:HK97 family phage major capsid protein/HK97 family phage prohead protease
MTEHLSLELKVGTVDDAGSFEGIASVFGEIDGMGDTVAPGAFRKSLAAQKRKGRTPLMLWSHQLDQPIGRWTDIKETSEGLTVKGKLLLDVARAREVYSMLKERVVDGLSIGFRTVDSARTKTGRLLKEIDLAEISLVSLPALASARVLSVKGDAMSLDVSVPDDDTETPKSTVTMDLHSLDRIESKHEATAELAAGLATRLDRIETKLARPSARIEVREDQEQLERKAFTQLMRKGWDGLGDIEKKVLTASPAGSPSADGFTLVPQYFVNELMRNLVEINPVRQVARVTNVSGNPVVLPKRLANLTASWIPEGAQDNLSQPTYGQQSVNVYEMRVTVEITNQLLEDSAFDMSAELSRDIAEEFGRLEGVSFVSGTGTGEPQGFLTDSTLQTIGGGGQLTADDLIDLYYSLPPQYASRGTWVMPNSVMASIRKLKNAQGQYLWVEAIAVDRPATILGRPVVMMPTMIGTGSPTHNNIVFGDFNTAVRIFDRVGLEILRDPYSAARYSIVQFHARRRTGSALVEPAAIKALVT